MPKAKMDFALAKVSYDSNDLLTMKQIAKLTGLSYWYVRALNSGVESSKLPFPPPDTEIGRSPLWHRQTIKAWNKDRKALARKKT